MYKDWSFETDDYSCGFRTAAVLIKNNKILVQRDRNGTAFALPGGHVRTGETSENALIREISEEIGADIKCKRLLWIEESFWNGDEKQKHNIAFYYLVELCENQDIPDNGEFFPQKDNDKIVVGWLPFDKLQNTVVFPGFLKNEIYNLNDSVKRFVSI